MNRVLHLTLFVLLSSGFGAGAREAKEPKPTKEDGGSKGKEKEPKEKEAPIEWHEHLVPGPAALLRLKHEEGKFLIYDGSLVRTQTGANTFTENSSFYLTVLCAKQHDEIINGKTKTLDLLAIRRSYTDRNREEVLENGKKISRALENIEDLISIGPNFEIVGALRCHAYDTQNCAAYRTEQVATLKDGRQFRGRILTEDADKIVFLTDTDKVDLPRADVQSTTLIPQPHVCLNESPHYLFPPFSEQKKSPGDTWRFKVPIIIPLQQGTPPQIFPTQFNAVVTSRLCEVKQAGASQIATIEYRVSGVFDSKSEEYSNRFSEAFHADNHIVHKIDGGGVLLFDVEKGRIIEKTESLNFSLYGASMVAQPLGKPAKQVENHIEITSRYEIKLMLPGAKMKNGKTIPNYD